MTRIPYFGFLLCLFLGFSLPEALSAAQSPPLAGDLALPKAAECGDLRRESWESFLSAPPRLALGSKPLEIENAYGSWRRSSMQSGKAFYLIFSAERNGSYPLYSQGSWIVKRSLADGRFLQAKIFLRSDPGTFIRIYPAGERSRMDLIVYGAVLRREIALPFSFERILSSSLSELLEASADSVDWELFSPRPGLYAELRSLVVSIREKLPALRYVEDGALDREGRPVFIATGLPQLEAAGLNCSGFAKWVVDGLYRPLTGSWLDTRELAQRGIGLRGSSFSAARELEEDPYFGLDWTRNLAASLAEAAFPSRKPGLLEADVVKSPFALMASEAADPVNGGSSYESYPAYEKDSGYQARGLKALLYVLALEEPGSFYLGSLNRNENGLRKHYHVAVLLPYFEESGEFRVAVFESAAETSLEALIARGPRDFVHLVRLSPRGSFLPPILP